MKMSDKVVKKVCRCENCGNEAEMMITCSLPSADEDQTREDAKSGNQESPKQVKGTAVCSHCGNEADMWIDL
jgi:thymidine kinase